MSLITDNQKTKILKLLTEKSVVKQNVFNNTIKTFDLLTVVVNAISSDLIIDAEKIDKRLSVAVSNSQKYALQLKVAGDVLEFFMHTNVFEFDKNNEIYKTEYVKQNEYNSYCGIINIYNFLADSFKYNRLNDVGYLMCRIYINRENKFFIECKAPIGAKYNSFSVEPISAETLHEIVNELIIYALTFDLFVPPYDSIKQVSVIEIQQKLNSQNLRTGKRLGYSNSATITDDDQNLYI